MLPKTSSTLLFYLPNSSCMFSERGEMLCLTILSRIHGGNDAVIDISQSTLLKTLLAGIGVTGVKLRAYRELGHVEAIACKSTMISAKVTYHNRSTLPGNGQVLDPILKADTQRYRRFYCFLGDF